MRAPVVVLVLTHHLFCGAAARAEATRDAGKVVQPIGLEQLKASAQIPGEERADQASRERETVDELPPEPRGLRAVLLRGGQVSLAGGPLVLEVGRDGRLTLLGHASDQQRAADEVLRNGGTLAIDESKEIRVREGRVAEVRVRDADTVHILVPSAAHGHRAVAVYYEAVPQPLAGLREELHRIEAWVFSLWHEAEAVLHASQAVVVDQASNR